jgi:hypothetical protein
LGDKGLPLMQFTNSCPVYFDRHTLSIKDDKLSMFTLDGRMHFHLTLQKEQLMLFKVAKLREISLTYRTDGLYQLTFNLDQQKVLSEPEAQAMLDVQLTSDFQMPPGLLAAQSAIPDYVSVEVSI